MSFWTFASVAVIAFVIFHVFPDAMRQARDKVRADFVIGCMNTNRAFGTAGGDTTLGSWCVSQSMNYGLRTLGEQ